MSYFQPHILEENYQAALANARAVPEHAKEALEITLGGETGSVSAGSTKSKRGDPVESEDTETESDDDDSKPPPKKRTKQTPKKSRSKK